MTAGAALRVHDGRGREVDLPNGVRLRWRDLIVQTSSLAIFGSGG